jgi:hypothetical protein
VTPPHWHHDIEQLLGVYAVDATDADERRLVGHHIECCASCDAEVTGHWGVTAMLTLGGPPPGGGWDRIIIGLEEPPPPLELVPVIRLRSRKSTALALIAMTAVAAAAMAVVGIQTVDHDRRLDRMQTTMNDGDGFRRSAVAALADPTSARLALTSADTPVVAHTAILPDGRGYLMADQLPRLAANRTYQLWVLIAHERISAGILGRRPMVVAFHGGQRFDGLAITEESAGGVAVSNNTPVVFGRRPPS